MKALCRVRNSPDGVQMYAVGQCKQRQMLLFTLFRPFCTVFSGPLILYKVVLWYSLFGIVCLLKIDYNYDDKFENGEEVYNILRSMMQVYVKGSVEAVNFYQKAFNAEILCTYPNDNGEYMHSELNAHGQILAVSELTDESVIGNTMQFCFHFGMGGEEHVKNAYDVLKDGATIHEPIGPCDYSSCMFALIDKFGVSWCLFV